MNLAQKAYDEMFTGSHLVSVKYSGKFKGYNANVKMIGKRIEFHASKLWRGVSPEIQKGLFQELLTRLLKSKKSSLNIDLYNNFLRSVSRVAPKTKTHPVLEESFHRVNSLMFSEMMDLPNLEIGNGINKLGTYDYGTDTVCISRILLDDSELLDYVMYHELLHKKHQFKKSGSRVLHHSKAFKDDESRFPDSRLLEKRLAKLVRRKKSWFSAVNFLNIYWSI